MFGAQLGVSDMNEPIATYRQLLGLTEARFTRVDHDDTMIAVVYRVTQPSKKTLILKICNREQDYHRELYFLNHLAGKFPSPLVLDVVEPQQSIDGAILMEYLEGNLLQIGDWTDSLAFEIGSILARLHLNSTSSYGDLTNPQESTLSPHIYFGGKFKEELAECSNHLPQKLIKKLAKYFDSHHCLLSEVDGPCMVHRDFRPGNIIIDHGKLKGIIDWASARSGFAEQDFCNMEHRKWPSQTRHKKSLLEGYASIRKVPEYHLVMPLLQLGRAIGVIGYTVKSSTWESKNKKIYQYNRQFLEDFDFDH